MIWIASTVIGECENADIPSSETVFKIKAANDQPTVSSMPLESKGASPQPRTNSLGGGISLRIMPLGASITWGQGSTDGNGYREKLKVLLTGDGNAVDYVGSQTSGNMSNNQNEGFPGAVINQVFAHAKTDVPRYLPNLFLVNAGTNDCIQNLNVSTAQDRLLSMTEFLLRASPLSTVILSTLIVNADNATEANVEIVNANYKTMVEQQQALKKKIILVDMHGPDGPQLSDLVSDGTHPDDAGYEKMALLWFRGIKNAASRGWLKGPQQLPHIDIKL